MNLIRTILLAVLLGTAVAGPLAATADAAPRTQHSTSSHKRNSRPKTVHVKSYKKKDGTVVKAHDRAAPQPK